MTQQRPLAGRRRESLIDAIDRLVDVGTVISGDAIIRLADVDLIHLDLRLLLAAIIGPTAPAEPPAGDSAADSTASAGRAGGSGAGTEAGAPPLPPVSSRGEGGGQPGAGAQRAPEGGGSGEQRLDQGLGQLVVAVVELVRQLLERQAVRRVRAGTLDQQQQERLGAALQALEQRMVELREALGVSPSELDQAIGTVEQMLDSSSTDPASGGEQERRVS